jgi:hypothetical protein
MTEMQTGLYYTALTLTSSQPVEVSVYLCFGSRRIQSTAHEGQCLNGPTLGAPGGQSCFCSAQAARDSKGGQSTGFQSSLTSLSMLGRGCAQKYLIIE